MTTVADKTPQGRVTLTEQGNRLSIKFPYDVVLVNKVKTLSDRRWHSADRRWTAALTLVNVAKLREWGFSFDGKVTSSVLDDMLKEADRKNQPSPVVELGPLKEFFDDYQIEGVQKIEAFGGRALLADDPGLGKTPQCLAWLRIHPELRPAVIVAKATGKLVWQRIAKRGILTPTGYLPLLPDDRVQIINGVKPVEIDADVIIVNYDILAKVEDCPECNGDGERNARECGNCKGKGTIVGLREDLVALNPAVVVLDEPQQICEPKAQRTIAALALTKKPKYLLAATATPIKKKPKEFFNILHRLRPDIFPSFWRYAQRYCAAKHNGFGWNFNGASHIDELYEILAAHVMIRRRKSQVMGDLPLNRQVVPLEIKNRSDYDRADEDFMSWLSEQGDAEKLLRAERAQAIVRMSALYRLAAEMKTNMVITWIRDFLESERKLIVFTMHTALLDRIMAEFPDLSVRLDGSTSQKDRQAAEDRFQEDPTCLLFAGNSDAAGDTITLTAAYDIAFAELPKTPVAVYQNEGRAYGRKNDPHGINSWFLVAADTVEEERAERLNIDARVVDHMLDGKQPDEDDDMIQLINNRRKKGELPGENKCGT